MITYFADRNHESKTKYKNYKMLTTIWKSFDTSNLFATTSSSFTLSLTGIGLILIPVSTATTCGLSIGNKVINEIITQKKNKYKNKMKKIDKLSNFLINYTENLCSTTWLTKMNMNICVKFSLKKWMKQKMNFFLNIDIKKIYIFLLIRN